MLLPTSEFTSQGKPKSEDEADEAEKRERERASEKVHSNFGGALLPPLAQLVGFRWTALNPLALLGRL